MELTKRFKLILLEMLLKQFAVQILFVAALGLLHLFFNGKDVKPGTHVNGVGSYLPHMREVDFEFIQRASKIVVDDLEGVTEEAGELIHAATEPDWGSKDSRGTDGCCYWQGRCSYE